MSKGLGSEFSRLMRASKPHDPKAPWWVNWLMNAAVTGIVIYGLLSAADWVWLKLTGSVLNARCGVLTYLGSFVPGELFLSLGLIITLIGIVLMIGEKTRMTGLMWLVLGALLSSLPELLGFHEWNMS